MELIKYFDVRSGLKIYKRTNLHCYNRPKLIMLLYWPVVGLAFL